MLRVYPARPQQRKRALRLLLASESGSEPAAGDVFGAVENDELALGGLLIADRDGEIVGTALYVMQADLTAFVWPPRVVPESDGPAVADALLAELSRRIDRAGAWLGQCLIEPGEPVDREALCRNGFEHLADLIYLERRLNQALPARSPIEFERVEFDSARNRSEFAGILESTYSGTLDCPALNGKRSGAEALDGHRESGRFHPSRWKIYRRGGRNVGVLLLNDHPEQDAWEVVYMGIVPDARGQGYGRAMLLDGLNEARDARRSSVLLAVDSRNRYARKVYDDLGFVEQTVRAVHARCRPDRAASE